jgi:hypothetical protein
MEILVVDGARKGDGKSIGCHWRAAECHAYGPSFVSNVISSEITEILYRCALQLQNSQKVHKRQGRNSILTDPT